MKLKVLWIKVWHESCECARRLNGNAYNSKQKWSHDKYPCECKEPVDWSCGNVES